MLDNSKILITGGTGSFGKCFVNMTLKRFNPKCIFIYSRDEMKQWEMAEEYKNDDRIKFIIGDVRDKERLSRSLDSIDYVVHAAATKIVPTAEYNPFECVKTNINGAMNVIDTCIDKKIKRVVALSTDKACNPINLYGATKLCAEKLFINANQLSGEAGTKFSVVRYGNVIASRGSVIPFFQELIKNKAKFLPLTHQDMTRFFITLPDSVKFVFNNLKSTSGGEIAIPKMNSIFIKDLIKKINPRIKIKIVGARPGEKINEVLYSKDESNQVYETSDSFKIYPSYKTGFKKSGRKLNKHFEYVSNSKRYLNKKAVIKLIKKTKVLDN